MLDFQFAAKKFATADGVFKCREPSVKNWLEVERLAGLVETKDPIERERSASYKLFCSCLWQLFDTETDSPVPVDLLVKTPQWWRLWQVRSPAVPDNKALLAMTDDIMHKHLPNYEWRLLTEDDIDELGASVAGIASNILNELMMLAFGATFLDLQTRATGKEALAVANKKK